MYTMNMEYLRILNKKKIGWGDVSTIWFWQLNLITTKTIVILKVNAHKGLWECSFKNVGSRSYYTHLK